MNNPSRLLASIIIAAASQATLAADLSCRSGYTHVTITDGTVATVNVSETKQVGQICLAMVNDAGRVVFDDCGALIGTVTEKDALGNPAKLSHTAVFELLESFKTDGDQVLYGVPLSECSFQIGESMAKLKWGTGVFLGGQLKARADGVVSFCPGQNKNTFAITGEACLRLR